MRKIGTFASVIVAFGVGGCAPGNLPIGGVDNEAGAQSEGDSGVVDDTGESGGDTSISPQADSGPVVDTSVSEAAPTDAGDASTNSSADGGEGGILCPHQDLGTISNPEYCANACAGGISPGEICCVYNPTPFVCSTASVVVLDAGVCSCPTWESTPMYGVDCSSFCADASPDVLAEAVPDAGDGGYDLSHCDIDASTTVCCCSGDVEWPAVCELSGSLSCGGSGGLHFGTDCRGDICGGPCSLPCVDAGH